MEEPTTIEGIIEGHCRSLAGGHISASEATAGILHAVNRYCDGYRAGYQAALNAGRDGAK
jgi:hypothetical protein